jgi:hypothetical protein
MKLLDWRDSSGEKGWNDDDPMVFILNRLRDRHLAWIRWPSVSAMGGKRKLAAEYGLQGSFLTQGTSKAAAQLGMSWDTLKA